MQRIISYTRQGIIQSPHTPKDLKHESIDVSACKKASVMFLDFMASISEALVGNEMLPASSRAVVVSLIALCM